MFKSFALLAVLGVVACASADGGATLLTDGSILTPGLIQGGILVPANSLYSAQGLVAAPYYGRLLPVTGKSIGVGIGGGIGIGAGKGLVRVGPGLAVPGVGIGIGGGIGIGAGKTLYGPGGVVLRRPGLGLGVGFQAGIGIGAGKGYGVPYGYGGYYG